MIVNAKLTFTDKSDRGSVCNIIYVSDLMHHFFNVKYNIFGEVKKQI